MFVCFFLVENDLCLTPFCIKAGLEKLYWKKKFVKFDFLANYLFESIDESVVPCENFFKFACGTWLKNNRIPDDS